MPSGRKLLEVMLGLCVSPAAGTGSRLEERVPCSHRLQARVPTQPAEEMGGAVAAQASAGLLGSDGADGGAGRRAWAYVQLHSPLNGAGAALGSARALAETHLFPLGPGEWTAISVLSVNNRG